MAASTRFWPSRPLPYDAPSRALAAALYAVRPDENYFALSEPGIISILDNGRTRFTPSPTGRHHYLIVRPDQKERVVQTYVDKVTSQPPPPAGGRGAGAWPGTAALTLLGGVLTAGLLFGLPAPISGQGDAFDSAVRPVLTQTCAQCHGGPRPAGGMSVAELTSAESLVQRRDVWDAILRRVRAGDMPPAGTTRPDPTQISALIGYIERAFDQADASVKPDPGRMVAHRLNRSEYANTIRDLLGVHFRAEKDFPTDDSGEGFDNIGGNGSLLDNSMIVYGAGLADGNQHIHDDLPTLIAGRGGDGYIKTGRRVVYQKETPMCNLFLTMMDRMGTRMDHFGDATGHLNGLDLT